MSVTHCVTHVRTIPLGISVCFEFAKTVNIFSHKTIKGNKKQVAFNLSEAQSVRNDDQSP